MCACAGKQQEMKRADEKWDGRTDNLSEKERRKARKSRMVHYPSDDSLLWLLAPSQSVVIWIYQV